MTLLDLDSISKEYGGIVALENASLSVQAGSIHGLVGPNGAGKSTLMKVAAGEVAPDEGTIAVDGAFIRPAHILEAQGHGIVAMPQELMLAGDLSVEENIVIGAEPRRGPLVDRRERRRVAADLLDRLGLAINPRTIVADLRPSEQRMVMFAHALHRQAKLMILDEPTAAMSVEEARTVLAAVRTLRSHGIAVVYVSHRLDEILELCDRVTLMRDGHTVSTVERASLTKERLVASLLGSSTIERAAAGAAGDSPVVCTLREVVGNELRGVDLEIRRGEVLGVAGLPGSGAGELLEILAGKSSPDEGVVTVDGTTRRFRSPADALRAGVSFLPGERRQAGFLDLPLRVNVLASKLGAVARAGVTVKAWESKLAGSMLGQVSVDPRTEAPLSSMSGGNQQRALVARSLAAGSQIVVLDDPMAGVDIGARAGLRDLLLKLARDGRAIVVGASEPEELALFADRVAVMARGRLVEILEGDELTPSAVLAATISEELQAEVQA